MIPCPNVCDTEFERRFLNGHLDSDCPRRKMPCQYCEQQVQLDEMQPHFEECTRFEVQCVNKCGNKSIARDDVSDLNRFMTCINNVLMCTNHANDWNILCQLSIFDNNWEHFCEVACFHQYGGHSATLVHTKGNIHTKDE